MPFVYVMCLKLVPSLCDLNSRPYLMCTFGSAPLAVFLWQFSFGTVPLAFFFWQCSFGSVALPVCLWQCSLGSVPLAV